MWIESHQELGSHPKTQKLARILGLSKPTVVGHLQYLWWWATDYAQDGDLSRFDSLDIAIGAEWEGNPDLFLDALIRAGFVDGGEGLCIHDWHDYAGKLIERREKNAARMRDARAGTKTERAAHVQGTQRARATLPNKTQHNKTEPNRTLPKNDAQARPVGEPFEALVALCEATGADVSELSGSVKSKQLGKAKQLLADGMTVADIGRCAGYCASQSWRSGSVDMFTVEKERGKWEMAGKRAVEQSKTSNGNGRASPAKLTPFEETQAAIDEVFGRINGTQSETHDDVFETTWKVNR